MNVVGANQSGSDPHHRRCSATIALTLLLVVPLLTAASDYRFTYTNPSIGSRTAPFVLEYFSLVDCAPCLRFELETLQTIMPLVDDGRLRIVFRDIFPHDDVLGSGLELFCLQEYPDYLQRRQSAKKHQVFVANPEPALPRKARARYESCLETKAGVPILTYNQESFDRRQLHGTPSFSLLLSHRTGTVVRNWSGSITASDLNTAMGDLLSRIQ